MDGYVNAGIAASPASRSQCADFALGAWNEHWLMSYEAVRCRHCLAPQWSSNALYPVRHCPGCERSQAHCPLRDLTKVLVDLQAVVI